MSRIGKKPIEIPAGVEVTLLENKVGVKGPKGELTFEFSPVVEVEKKENQINVICKNENDHYSRSVWGMTRSLISNMIYGVTEGFEKKLEFIGVGFRAAVEKEGEGDKLVLNVGYSHPKEIIAPKDVNFKVEKNVITVLGIDKEVVGEVAAGIRRVRPPEPYKGKGIKYIDEHIRRKEGKAVAKAGAAGAGGE